MLDVGIYSVTFWKSFCALLIGVLTLMVPIFNWLWQNSKNKLEENLEIAQELKKLVEETKLALQSLNITLDNAIKNHNKYTEEIHNCIQEDLSLAETSNSILKDMSAKIDELDLSVETVTSLNASLNLVIESLRNISSKLESIELKEHECRIMNMVKEHKPEAKLTSEDVELIITKLIEKIK